VQTDAYKNNYIQQLNVLRYNKPNTILFRVLNPRKYTQNERVNETQKLISIKDVREPASSYYAGSHRTGHRLAMGSKMAVCLRSFDNGADSIPSNIASRRLY